MGASVAGIVDGCLVKAWTFNSSGTKQARRGDGWSDGEPPAPFGVLVRGWLADGLLSLVSFGFDTSAKRTLFACFNIPGGRLFEDSLLTLLGKPGAIALV